MNTQHQNEGSEFKFFLPAKISHIDPGVGSFLNLYMFGNLATGQSKDDPPSKIQIWIYLCDWIIYQGGVEVLNSEVIGGPKQTFSLASFNNLSMLDFQFDVDNDCVVFHFDNDLKIKMMPNVEEYGEDEDLFRVYLDDGILFSFSWARKFYWDAAPTEH